MEQSKMLWEVRKAELAASMQMQGQTLRPDEINSSNFILFICYFILIYLILFYLLNF
jgi:hypothetical protein